jgi:magnesium-transporting ATPase (P-type)
VQTLVFNVFVFAQIFNLFNSRRLDNKVNVFEGMSKNWYFWAITFIGSSLTSILYSLANFKQRFLFKS